jgi:hypothetical protein
VGRGVSVGAGAVVTPVAAGAAEGTARLHEAREMARATIKKERSPRSIQTIIQRKPGNLDPNPPANQPTQKFFIASVYSAASAAKFLVGGDFEL